MKTDTLIRDLEIGDAFMGFYVLKSAQQRLSSAQKPFLNMTLADSSGEINAKLWDYSGPFGAGEVGKIVKIQGVVSEYNGTPQVTVQKIRLPNDNDRVDLDRLVPSAPIDVGAAMDELRRIVGSISDEDYRSITEEMLDRHETALRTIPAAKSFHHSFRSGLLMHTLNMLRIAEFLADLYIPTIDRSLLLAGTCLHDIAKEQEFDVSPLGLVTDYSVTGKLLGHLVLGAQEVAQIAAERNISQEKSVLLQHMILSHHGEHAYGAAVLPVCAESELLSLIDRIDSRMEIYEETLERIPTGTFSERILPLDKQIYAHPIFDEN